MSPLLIAQVTDIHLFAEEDHQLLGMPTTKSFQAVIERLEDLQSEVDIILLTGDLSGDGKPASYENLQNLLHPLQIPSYWIPGNHDSAIVMNEVLNLGMISRRKSFERGSWNFILLNSSSPGCVHGYLTNETLDWLNTELKTLSHNPTLIALHHPPLRVNSQWLDTSVLQNPQELFAVLDCHPQVKLVLFGHIHQEFQYQRHHVNYLGTPSTCIQFKSQSPTFAIEHKAPGFRLLKLYPNGTWETWVERVPFVHRLELTATGY